MARIVTLTPVVKDTIVYFLEALKYAEKEKTAINIGTLADSYNIPYKWEATNALLKSKWVEVIEKVGRKVIIKCSFSDTLSNVTLNAFLDICKKESEVKLAARAERSSNKEKPKENLTKLSEDILDRFTDSQLLKVLRLRGYKGQLEKVTQVVI